MKIVFLGCGYLGYNLAKLFSKWDHTRCLGIPSEYSVLIKEQFIEVDVFDVEAMKKIDLEDAIVVDTVTLIGNQTTSLDEEALLNQVKEKYECLFEVLLSKKIKQFVLFSSGGTVYGNATEPLSEEAQVSPINLYARSKVMLEKSLEKSGLNYLILRVANPFGGYQLTNKRQGVIPILIEKALNNEPFELRVSLEATRDYFYIDDFYNMLRSLLNNKVSNEIVNIGSGEGTSLKSLIKTIEETTNKKIILKEVPSVVQEVNYIVLNINKLKSLTNYTREYTLVEAIKKEVKRIREG